MRTPTVMVTVPQLIRPSRIPTTRDYTISALCPRCGGPRGTPEPRSLYDEHTGHWYCADEWVNPCGHADDWLDIVLEAEMQCASPGCVVPACWEDDPYCSAACAADDWIRSEHAAVRTPSPVRGRHLDDLIAVLRSTNRRDLS